ncbi:FAD-dependent oxidoreductase [Methanosarcina vacuolata]|uniref:Geranylgeranyl diphosphate reductase n=1 Tax=Methanosarcina vacuolata Z-761 TaxID=1434123 RepID=A0A0E3Q851_9EURY|nr:FAD-dependent oxidoreductase [Methanosarcina vacuolata]AKB45047.1 Geranylgeranyl diphosphate reductase [Methanosarcina vacuolata Z-761]
MYDLIIVGGGPSGASAGQTAGKRGLSTLLIEKENFPRYNPVEGLFLLIVYLAWISSCLSP